MKFIENNPSENYYGEEVLGGVKYFSAIYPDTGNIDIEQCPHCEGKMKIIAAIEDPSLIKSGVDFL